MSPALSLYLDLLRFGAALFVMLFHLWPLVMPRLPLPWPGHEAVVIFFVLSGYVISHAAAKPGESIRTFLVKRAARILSVAWPALVLALLISLCTPSELQLGDPVKGPVHGLAMLWPTLLNAVFLGQSWGMNAPPPFNPPYWSLDYEVWYYVIFACWTFQSGWLRTVSTVVACLVAGPRILVMMPIWLLGVYAYRRPVAWSKPLAALVFIASLLAALALFYFDVSRQLRAAASGIWPVLWAQLHGSNQFIGDTLMAVLFAIHLQAASRLDVLHTLLRPFERLIRSLASFTLSTYLYHMPLASLIWIGLGLQSRWMLLPLVLLAIAALGSVTERQLPAVRRLIDRVLGHRGMRVVTPRSA